MCVFFQNKYYIIINSIILYMINHSILSNINTHQKKSSWFCVTTTRKASCFNPILLDASPHHVSWPSVSPSQFLAFSTSLRPCALLVALGRAGFHPGGWSTWQGGCFQTLFKKKNKIFNLESKLVNISESSKKKLGGDIIKTLKPWRK